MNIVETKADYIWSDDALSKNQHVLFYKEVVLKEICIEVTAIISVDTKYWLYINGKQVVFEGGLFRESIPGCGYADIVDISPYLVKGKNMIAIECWYYGNEGRNNIDSKTPYLLFECEQLSVYSDNTFKVRSHPAFYQTIGIEEPSFLYGGYNIGFNANLDIEDAYYPRNLSSLKNASICKNVNNVALYERNIPFIKKYEYRISEMACVNNKFVLKLPYAMSALIKLVFHAVKGTVINIKTDRYFINGGPGDEISQYSSHRIEYVCKDGINVFSSSFYLYGEEFIIETSRPIEVIESGYSETGYDCDITGKFNCSCEIINKLVEKSARTLYVCMRDNFMDCPDRERGQWIGDVAVQAPQVFFLLSKSARLLLKKSIYDFINLKKSDKLMGCVPGICSLELPVQNLIAIGEYGIIATYHKYTGDLDILEISFESNVKYLMLWDMDNGLIKHRDGDWNWYDHLYNVDETVLENAWYYSALKFAKKSADLLNNINYNEFLNDRLLQIQNNFDKKFWNGEYYSSGRVVDDRANALAVIAGLCEPGNYFKVRSVLCKVFNATVFMENYILEALCQMGYIKDAYNRMVSRYYNLAVNENSTLWEDFFVLGTKNHAWSGSPATIAFKYFMGIDTVDGFKTFTVNPAKDIFEFMNCEFYIDNKKIELNFNFT